MDDMVIQTDIYAEDALSNYLFAQREIFLSAGWQVAYSKRIAEHPDVDNYTGAFKLTTSQGVIIEFTSLGGIKHNGEPSQSWSYRYITKVRTLRGGYADYKYGQIPATKAPTTAKIALEAAIMAIWYEGKEAAKSAAPLDLIQNLKKAIPKAHIFHRPSTWTAGYTGLNHQFQKCKVQRICSIDKSKRPWRVVDCTKPSEKSWFVFEVVSATDAHFRIVSDGESVYPVSAANRIVPTNKPVDSVSLDFLSMLDQMLVVESVKVFVDTLAREGSNG